jgi:surface protein
MRWSLCLSQRGGRTSCCFLVRGGSGKYLVWARKDSTTTALSPLKCFETRDELRLAVDTFMLGGDSLMVKLEKTYGLPIGTWCVSNIQDFSSFLSNERNSRAAIFNEDLAAWDVSKVSTMNYMFHFATAFDQDLSSWNTSSVQDLSNMFAYASSFNKDLAAWDISKVSTTNGMFYDAPPFDQDLSSWNTSSVDDFSFMFEGASSFNKDLAAWDVSKVYWMQHMFSRAASFDQNLCSWGDKLPRDTDAIVDTMFEYTSCPTQDDPVISANTPGPFGYPCD